jgi:Icc-related predicted phosphoesterase
VITQIPFSTNTSTLIDSILKANEKGKIKIKKIEDNTAAEVEILIHLPPGVSPDKTIDALYAFTACETSVAPLGCVIQDNKPLFVGVSHMLKISTERTVELLRKELEIQLEELKTKWDAIPEDTDILITHGPAQTYLDTAGAPYNTPLLGCELLKERIELIRPKIHVCGHIHGGYGYYYNGHTHFFNASVLNERYSYANLPFHFEWDQTTNQITWL